MRNEKIPVQGMSCAHCKMTVEKAVAALSGVASVDADYRANVVTVSYDEGRTGLEQIRSAIVGAGYEVLSA